MNNAFYASDYIIVGLDFDGVLAQGLNTKIKYAKKWFDLDLKLGQTKKEGFNKLVKSLGRTDLAYSDLTKDLMKQYTLEYEVPLDCKEVLGKLFLENFRFCVITSRTNEEYPYAEAFIKENYGNLIENIHNESPHPNPENRWEIKKREKSYFVHYLKPRIYIDDDIEKLKALRNYPVELFYCRQPENFDKDLGILEKIRIQEFNDWSKFYDMVIQIKDLHEAICWKFGIVNKFSNLTKIYREFHKLSCYQKENLLLEYNQERQVA